MPVSSKSPKSLSKSSSLFDTFGNETKQKIDKSTLVKYLENATVKFPIPEASTDILAQFADPTRPAINPDLLSLVETRLIKAGYQPANAKAMADVLMQTATRQGVNPLTYFNVTDETVQLTVDTYKILNAFMPPGNRFNLTLPKDNRSNSRVFTAK